MTDIAHRNAPAPALGMPSRRDDGAGPAAAALAAFRTPERFLASRPVLLALQASAGNRAVGAVLSRAPGPGSANGPAQTPSQTPAQAPAPAPGPAGAGNTPATPATPAPDPLDDARIRWIEELPTTVRLSIDAVGDDKLKRRIASLDSALATRRAAIEAAATPDAKATAKTAMESSAEYKAKEEIDRKYGSSWATKRLALMEYLGCSLGGDTGVERYYRSLVPFGPSELYVHPEAARRLIRVRDVLQGEGIPMPQTDNGFALRGRHVHPTKQDKQPGMMTHSLGVAIDWYAYKNVHFKDEALMALVDAVTGEPHNLRLPARGLPTIVALGEQSMGNALTAQQQKDAAGGQALIDAIGTEFDRLAAASDRFRDSLTFDKTKLLDLHHTLVDLQATVEGRDKALAAARRRRNNEAGIRTAQEALDRAKGALAAKMLEVKPQLEELFKPWLTSLSDAVDAARAQAAPLLGQRRLEDVLTDAGLASKEQSVAAGTGAAAKDLKALVARATSSARGTAALRAAVAGAQAWLAASGSEQDRADWSARLADLEARAARAAERTGAAQREGQVLRGGAPAAPPAAPAVPKGKPRRPNLGRSVPAWEKDLAAREAEAGAAETALATATAKVPKEAVDAAHALRDERAVSEEIRSKVTRDQFQQLQDLKAKLFHLQQASSRLLTDASFMFKPRDVRDPGVAQLVGVLGEDPKDKRDLGGGGFFGTPTSGLEAAQKGKPNAASGFAKRFFQVMVQHGFEPAASWHTSDSMHFQVRGLVDQIVPAEACTEPAPGAEASAKDDKARSAIADRRAKAAAARAAGESFSSGAADARTRWGTEGARR